MKSSKQATVSGSDRQLTQAPRKAVESQPTTDLRVHRLNAKIESLRIADAAGDAHHEHLALFGTELLRRQDVRQAEGNARSTVHSMITAMLAAAWNDLQTQLCQDEIAARLGVETAEIERFELICGIRQRQLVAIDGKEQQSRGEIAVRYDEARLQSKFQVVSRLEGKLQRDVNPESFFVTNREALHRLASADFALLLESEEVNRSTRRAEEVSEFTDICLTFAKALER